jgi:hypothetical protein
MGESRTLFAPLILVSSDIVRGLTSATSVSRDHAAARPGGGFGGGLSAFARGDLRRAGGRRGSAAFFFAKARRLRSTP